MNKESNYNTFQLYKSNILAYNSYQNKFLLLDTELYELYKASINENNLEGLKEIHIDFYNSLVNNGFFVEENIDELQQIRNKMELIDNDESKYHIIINPTMNCNFKCWYCYESHIKGSKMNEPTIDRVFNFIDNIVLDKKIKTIQLSWFGGEPLLYYKKVMIPILEYIQIKATEMDISYSSDATSNGMLINHKMIAEFKKYNLKSFQITLDGNESLHNTVRFVNEEKGSYQKIVENIKLLCNNKINVNLRINFTAETLDNILDILDDIKDLDMESRNYLRTTFHKVWQVQINDEQIKLLQGIKNKFKIEGFIISKQPGLGIKNSCYADKENQATINYNGEVHKCTAKDFNTKNSEGVLNTDGTISWNERRKKRKTTKLDNKPCLECAILPLCGSGCSQLGLDSNGEDYCVYNFDEDKKKDLVISHFKEQLIFS